MDIPRLRHLYAYWQQVPPLHIAVASYLGAIKQPAVADIEEASSYMPVNRVSEAEFDELLKQHGLPTG